MTLRQVEYFEKAGPANTEYCLDVACRMVETGYNNIVVASTTGDTGVRLSRRLHGLGANLVVVTHSAGFKEPNSLELTIENEKEIRRLGGRIFTGSILTHSLETSLAAQFSGIYPTMLIAQSLRRFGEGAKVCCEIVMEACDAGLIPEEEEVVALAGTGRGCDTVVIVRAAASKRFLKLKVLEVLAKPRE